MVLRHLDIDLAGPPHIDVHSIPRSPSPEYLPNGTKIAWLLKDSYDGAATTATAPGGKAGVFRRCARVNCDVMIVLAIVSESSRCTEPNVQPGITIGAV